MVTILKQAGEHVAADLTIKVGQDEIAYEVKEDQDKIPHEMTSEEKAALAHYEEEKKHDDWATRPWIRKYDRPYNGHLRIRFIVAGKHKRYLKDGKQPLEEQLPAIIAAFYATYLETKREREQQEIEERKRKLAEQREQHHRQRIAAEKQRVVSLINAAKDYQLATVVRRYAAAVKKKSSGADQDKFAWMQGVADWFDPLVSGDNLYLEKRQHGDSDEQKANFLGEETDTYQNSFKHALKSISKLRTMLSVTDKVI